MDHHVFTQKFVYIIELSKSIGESEKKLKNGSSSKDLIIIEIYKNVSLVFLIIFKIIIHWKILLTTYTLLRSGLRFPV